MKRILALICTMVLVLSICILPASAAGSGSLSVTGATGKQGDTVTLSVKLNSNPGLISMKFTVSYPSDLELTSVQNNGVLGGWTTPAPTISSPYTIRWADSLATANSTATGTLVTLTFKIKDTATPGAKTVSINFSESRNQDGEKNSFNSPSATVQVNCKTHSFGNQTSLNDTQHGKTCTACGYVEKANHSWDSGKVTTNPSCKDEGIKTYTCSVCSGTKTEAIAKTSHTYGTWTKVDDNNHARSCSVCSQKETAAHTWDKGTVTKPATCKEEGIRTYTCSTCKATKTEKIPTSEGHTYGAWTKVDDNTHKHTCTVCEKTETSAHTWNNGTVTKPATCKEEGTKTYTCTACKATKTEAIAKTTTHKYGSWTKVDDTTHERVCSVCEKKESGNHSYSTKWSKDKNEHWNQCTVCGDKKDVAAHKPGPAATEQRPQTCSVCGYVIKPALEHKHDYADTWESDEIGHWYSCSGCEEKGSYAEHDFENACDPDCSICGYTREVGHGFTVKSDEANHWNECEECGLKEEVAAHIPGAEATEEAAQSCTVCDYEIAPALEPATEIPTETVPAEVEPVSTDFPWWLVIVAVVVLAVGATVIIIKKKK